jgi:Protein of unknown function (DUF3225)
MKCSTDQILTTHTGRLPRPDDLTDLLVARQAGSVHGALGTREDEIHCGHSAISAIRRARGPVDQRRTLRGSHITTFGRDFGVAVTEYLLANSSRVGRQSQTWARLNGHWRIVNAHVSFGV